MAADISTRGAGTAGSARGRDQRLSTETRQSFKTSEFYVYIVASVAILIAGLVTKAGDGHDDRLLANQTWLYFAIVTGAYLVSRGLAKSGSREPYWAGGTNEARDRDTGR
ncbi:MAG: sle [Solirubrobacterales bacterium]|jgi:hypothetical protein|nr:sle [Solirubrobacterales bacterium]